MIPAHPFPTSERSCALCGAAITDQRRIGHWRERSGGGGYWYAGTCQKCDVDYVITRPGVSSAVDAPHQWYLDAPKPEWLGEPLLLTQLHELDLKVSQEADVRGAWLDFIRRARVGDEYHWYSFPEAAAIELPAPIARVRGGVPVAWFSPIDNLRFLEAPQARARAAEQAAHERARLVRRRRKAQERGCRLQ